MAFTSLPSKNVGDAIRIDEYTNNKDNTDDLDSRLNSVETGANKVFVFNELITNTQQYANATGSLDGIEYFQAPFAFTLTSAIITSVDGSTSGTFEFDVQKSASIGGAYSTVFSTKPSYVGVGAGESSNAIFSTTAVAAGDWLRLDLTSLAVGGKRIVCELIGEVS